jgi:hypothetical protein
MQRNDGHHPSNLKLLDKQLERSEHLPETHVKHGHRRHSINSRLLIKNELAAGSNDRVTA